MRRLKDYFRIIAWQAGLGYLLLWAVTFWTLDEGANVFGKSGVCRPDAAKVLFYWVCDAASPLAILATVANVALTATVWAPVYIAAATVQPEAIAIALPIVAIHVIGLPLAIFVLVRLLAGVFELRHRFGARRPPAPQLATPDQGAVDASAAVAAPARPTASPRSGFGLRGQQSADS